MDFIPYGKQTIDQDDIDIVVQTLKSDFLTTGLKVNQFENEICKITNSKYCISVANGTAALHLSALALLNKDDKVLTTPNSFLATSNSILYANAKPIFIDICDDGSIDLDICEKYLKADPTIKAIFAVSFSGKILDQEKLKYLKYKYNIKILEDNAHTMGVELTHSDISIFSFHPVKHITTAEGGAIVTNDKKIFEKIKSLRNHGQDNTHTMMELGFNYRLNDISCALGISQLEKLDKFIQKRQNIAKQYNIAFDNHPLIKPLYPYTLKSYYHLFVIQIDFDKLNFSKDDLISKLRDKNIGVQVHYKPINTQPYYKKLGYQNQDTPNMNKYIKQSISLPIYPLLKKEQQQYVISNLLEIIDE
jgi:dTDP-4-amino-4,6-dideoxygalactose transaminase